MIWEKCKYSCSKWCDSASIDHSTKLSVPLYLLLDYTHQDRLVLSMEQELMRAHQRATKSHVPLSACSVLLERLLPKTTELLPGQGGIGGSFGERPVDEKRQATFSTLFRKSYVIVERPISRCCHVQMETWSVAIKYRNDLLCSD